MWGGCLSTHWSHWSLSCSSDHCKVAVPMCLTGLGHQLPGADPQRLHPQGYSPAPAAAPGSKGLLWLLCQIWQLRWLEAPVHDLSLCVFIPVAHMRKQRHRKLKKSILGLAAVPNTYSLLSSLDRNGGKATSRGFCWRFQG